MVAFGPVAGHSVLLGQKVNGAQGGGGGRATQELSKPSAWCGGQVLWSLEATGAEPHWHF